MATKKNENIDPNLAGVKVPEGGYTERYTGGNSDLDEGLKYWGDAYNKAKAAGDARAMQDANDSANMLRNQNGYAAEYATDDIQHTANLNPYRERGGLGVVTPTIGGNQSNKQTGGGFSYRSAPSYVNKYTKDISNLAAQILNRDAFSYNPETDETYQQYKDSYTRSGQRAMQDTLGQVSSRTGGYASSYATAAGQQAYDNYMAALSDKIPELKQLAYSMYQDEGNNQRNNINMLLSLDQNDYAKYQNTLNQYNADRSFDYGVFSDDRNYNYQLNRDNVTDTRYNTEWQHGLDREKVEDDRYANNTEYERTQNALDRAYQNDQAEFNKAMALWEMLGKANSEVSKILGVPVGATTTSWQYQQAQIRTMD